MCLKLLPISKFGKTHGNYRHKCKQCLNHKEVIQLSDSYIRRVLKKKGIIKTPQTVEIQRRLLVLNRNIKAMENNTEPFELTETFGKIEKQYSKSYARIIAERYSSRIAMDIEREFNKEINEQTLTEYLVHSIENS